MGESAFQVECAEDAAWRPIPLHGGNIMPACIREFTLFWKVLAKHQYSLLFSTAINCTEPPFPVKNNDLGRYNWTGTDGVDPRPYATAIKYFCPRENWGYPSTGESEVTIHCRNDGTWSNAFNIETCMSEF